jgi:predicted component of type VI protein secretion system
MQLRMKVVQGKPRGHCLVFPNGKFMFGRGPECDVRPNSDLISRQHCLLQVDDERALIRDLGSRNGTLINGRLVTGEQTLAHGDTLQLGPLVLEVILDVDVPFGGKSLCDTAMVAQDITTEARPAPVVEACELRAEAYPSLGKTL